MASTLGPPLILSLTCSEGSQLPHCELPYGEVHGVRASRPHPARNWGLCLVVCGELNPDGCQQPYIQAWKQIPCKWEPSCVTTALVQNLMNLMRYLEPCVCVVCVCVWSHFSHVQLFATLWTIALQVFLSMGFSMQEYWSGLPCFSSTGSSQPRDWTCIS